MQIGYGSLPRSNHSAPLHESTRLEGLGSSTSLPFTTLSNSQHSGLTLSSPYCPEHTLPLLETLQEDSPRLEDKVEPVEIKSEEKSTGQSSEEFTTTQVTQVLNNDLTLEFTANEANVGAGDASCPIDKQVLDDKITQSFPAFVPVYNGNDALEGLSLTEDKSLKESRISSNLTKSSQSMIVTVSKIFCVCFACVLIALILVAILAIEVDIDIFQRMRRIPEIEIFQTELYEPFKGAIWNFSRKLNS